MNIDNVWISKLYVCPGFYLRAYQNRNAQCRLTLNLILEIIAILWCFQTSKCNLWAILNRAVSTFIDRKLNWLCEIPETIQKSRVGISSPCHSILNEFYPMIVDFVFVYFNGQIKTCADRKQDFCYMLHDFLSWFWIVSHKHSHSN